jgi:hypothetical protein
MNPASLISICHLVWDALFEHHFVLHQKRVWTLAGSPPALKQLANGGGADDLVLGWYSVDGS